jgi:hypothetical protein
LAWAGVSAVPSLTVDKALNRMEPKLSSGMKDLPRTGISSIHSAEDKDEA